MTDQQESSQEVNKVRGRVDAVTFDNVANATELHYQASYLKNSTRQIDF